MPNRSTAPAWPEAKLILHKKAKEAEALLYHDLTVEQKVRGPEASDPGAPYYRWYSADGTPR